MHSILTLQILLVLTSTIITNSFVINGKLLTLNYCFQTKHKRNIKKHEDYLLKQFSPLFAFQKSNPNANNNKRKKTVIVNENVNEEETYNPAEMLKISDLVKSTDFRLNNVKNEASQNIYEENVKRAQNELLRLSEAAELTSDMSISSDDNSAEGSNRKVWTKSNSKFTSFGLSQNIETNSLSEEYDNMRATNEEYTMKEEDNVSPTPPSQFSFHMDEYRINKIRSKLSKALENELPSFDGWKTCPGCERPVTELEISDFGKCEFCRRDDLADPMYRQLSVRQSKINIESKANLIKKDDIKIKVNASTFEYNVDDRVRDDRSMNKLPKSSQVSTSTLENAKHDTKFFEGKITQNSLIKSQEEYINESPNLAFIDDIDDAPSKINLNGIVDELYDEGDEDIYKVNNFSDNNEVVSEEYSEDDISQRIRSSMEENEYQMQALKNRITFLEEKIFTLERIVNDTYRSSVEKNWENSERLDTMDELLGVNTSVSGKNSKANKLTANVEAPVQPKLVGKEWVKVKSVTKSRQSQKSDETAT